MGVYTRCLAVWVLLVFVCGASACAVADDGPRGEVGGAPQVIRLDGKTSQGTVNKLRARLRDIEEGKCSTDGVFSALEHLAMEPGYALDHVVAESSIGAHAVVYARQEGTERYATAEAYEAAHPDEVAQSFPMTVTTPDCMIRFHREVLGRSHLGATMEEYVERRKQRKGEPFLLNVQTDGTAEGFFEFVVLDVMGSNFCLFWHGLYRDDRAVCEASGLPRKCRFFRRRIDRDYDVPPKVRRKAKSLDLAPRVVFDGEAAKVSVVTFSMWRGFSRETYTLRREFPHRILGVEEEVLIPYGCGLWY